MAQLLPEIKTVYHGSTFEADLVTFGGVAKAFVEKAPDGSERMVLEGIASSSVKDRMGDTISRSFMQKFERQGVGMTTFLNHNYEVPEDVFGTIEIATLRDANDPVQGKCLDLFIRSVVDPSNPRAVKAWEMVKNGRKLGFSIGARVSEATPINPDDYWGGMDLQDGELMEVSVVGIPANQRAYIQAKGFRKRSGLPFDPERAETQKAVQENLALKNDDVTSKEGQVTTETGQSTPKEADPITKAGARHNAADLANLQKCYGAMKSAMEHQTAQTGHLQECYKGLEALMPGGGDEANHADGSSAGGGMDTEYAATVEALKSEIAELEGKRAELEANAVRLAQQIVKALEHKAQLENQIAVLSKTTMPRLTRPNLSVSHGARNRSQGAY